MQFEANLVARQGKKLGKFDIANAESAEQIRAEIAASTVDGIVLSELKKQQKKRHPTAPFTTSTMQQEASRKLGFTTRKTMKIAQELYEGMGSSASDAVGMITYMRTDSVVLSKDAVAEMRDFISSRYGPETVPKEPVFHKSKVKNAQEAHEGIRPTSVERTPASLRSVLNNDQYKLYDLIWRRAVASQMMFAIFDTVRADFDCGDYRLRATGSTLVSPGFIQVYQENQDESSETKDNNKGNNTSKDKKLPELNEGDKIAVNRVDAEQHFTEPPPRFTEASLVKTLELYGIGRPSTYASIISTLLGRQYVELEQKRFTPTDKGALVNKFLTNNFPEYCELRFYRSTGGRPG